MSKTFYFIIYDIGSRKQTVYVAKKYTEAGLINSILRESESNSIQQDEIPITTAVITVVDQPSFSDQLIWPRSDNKIPSTRFKIL